MTTPFRAVSSTVKPDSQINARSDWSISYGETHGKIARLLNYYVKAIEHRFLWVIG